MNCVHRLRWDSSCPFNRGQIVRPPPPFTRMIRFSFLRSARFFLSAMFLHSSLGHHRIAQLFGLWRIFLGPSFGCVYPDVAPNFHPPLRPRAEDTKRTRGERGTPEALHVQALGVPEEVRQEGCAQGRATGNINSPFQPPMFLAARKRDLDPQGFVYIFGWTLQKTTSIW